jgi:hypothetical protein
VCSPKKLKEHLSYARSAEMVDLNLSEIDEIQPIFTVIFRGFLIAGINILRVALFSCMSSKKKQSQAGS